MPIILTPDPVTGAIAFPPAAELVHRHGVIVPQGLARSVIVFPTETVYGIGAAWDAPEGIEAIFRIKGRGDKPLAVYLREIDEIETVIEVDEVVMRLARAFLPGPLTLVGRTRGRPAVGGLNPRLVSEGRTGVRLPAHPACRALLAALGRPLAATSANRSGCPSPDQFAAIDPALLAEAGFAIDCGKLASGPENLTGRESTVVDVSTGRPLILREGCIPAEAIRRALAGRAP